MQTLATHRSAGIGRTRLAGPKRSAKRASRRGVVPRASAPQEDRTDDHMNVPAAAALSLALLAAAGPAAADGTSYEDMLKDFRASSAVKTYEKEAKKSSTLLKANPEAPVSEGFSFSSIFGQPKPAANDSEKEKAAPAPKLALPKAPELKAPSLPSFSAPKVEMPSFSAPKMEMPSFSAPKIEMPSFSAPKIEMPKVAAPSLPKVEAPAFTPPKVDAPSFSAPKIDIPSFSAPKIEMPSFSAPKFDMPKIEAPKIDLPKMEAPKLPSLPTPPPTAPAPPDPAPKPSPAPAAVAPAPAPVVKPYVPPPPPPPPVVRPAPPPAPVVVPAPVVPAAPAASQGDFMEKWQRQQQEADLMTGRPPSAATRDAARKAAAAPKAATSKRTAGKRQGAMPLWLAEVVLLAVFGGFVAAAVFAADAVKGIYAAADKALYNIGRK